MKVLVRVLSLRYSSGPDLCSTPTSKLVCSIQCWREMGQARCDVACVETDIPRLL